MAGEGGQRMAELLRRPDQFSIPTPICRPLDATVAQDDTPQVAEGPLPVGQPREAQRETLAQAGNPTPMAGSTIRRQRCHGRNPREEPDALAGTSGSERGAPGNRRPYRDLLVRLGGTEPRTADPQVVQDAVSEQPLDEGVTGRPDVFALTQAPLGVAQLVGERLGGRCSSMVDRLPGRNRRGWVATSLWSRNSCTVVGLGGPQPQVLPHHPEGGGVVGLLELHVAAGHLPSATRRPVAFSSRFRSRLQSRQGLRHDPEPTR